MNTANALTVEPRKTVEVTVHYSLSEAGQKAALLAGRNAAKKQQISGDIPVELLDICTINEDGRVIADYEKPVAFNRDGTIVNYPYGIDTYQTAQDFPALFAADLLRRLHTGIHAKAAEIRAQREREETQEIANKVEREVNEQVEYQLMLERLESDLDADREGVPKVNFPSAWSFSRGQQWCNSDDHPLARQLRGRKKDVEEREKRQEAERAAAAKALVRAFLAEHGDSDQVERFDAGVLPAFELEMTLSDLAFRLLNEYPLFDLILEHQVLDALPTFDPKFSIEDYTDCEVLFRSIEATELNRDQWAQLKAMRAACPAAKIEARLHQATLDHQDVPWGVIERLGALATVKVAGVEVRREYAL